MLLCILKWGSRGTRAQQGQQCGFFFSLKEICILHELKNSNHFYFVFYKTEVVKLWLTGHRWPLACFYMAYQLRMDFTLFKVEEEKEEEEEEERRKKKKEEERRGRKGRGGGGGEEEEGEEEEEEEGKEEEEGEEEEEEETDFMWPPKPKIFTKWLFIEKFVKLCIKD